MSMLEAGKGDVTDEERVDVEESDCGEDDDE